MAVVYAVGVLLLLWFLLYPCTHLVFARLQLGSLVGDGRDRVVALTYDVETRRDWLGVLADLDEAGTPAALFVTASLAADNPDLARRTVEAGQVLGLRGRDAVWPWTSWSAISRDQARLAEAAGHPVVWYRPGRIETLLSVLAVRKAGLQRVLGQVLIRAGTPDAAATAARLGFSGVVLRVDAADLATGFTRDLTERLQRVGLACGPLSVLQPERSVIRRGWYWWEGEFTRQYDVETVPASDGGPPVFRLSVALYRGPPLTEGSVCITKGTPMAEIHFVNQTLGRESGVPTGVLRVVARLRRAFADTAVRVRDDPRYADCQLVAGVTVLDVGDAIARIGLFRTPARGIRMWFMRIYLVFLMAVFHRQGFRVFTRFARLRPIWVWLPREQFLARFAPEDRV